MGAVRLKRLRSLEPRDVPAYRVSEVAQYLRMPKATLRAWALGQGDFRPVLNVEAPGGVALLSFVNVVEAYVLNALRREHEIPLRKGRAVLHLLARLFPGEGHPLADRDLLTEGREVFVEHFGALVSAPRRQLAIREMLQGSIRMEPMRRAASTAGSRLRKAG